MTLKTSLIITGDSKTAQAAIEELDRKIDAMGKGAGRTAPAIDKLDVAVDKLDNSARDATAATGALAPAIVDVGRASTSAGAATGALDGAIVKVGGATRTATVATGAMSGALVRTATSARVAAVATGAVSAASTVATGALTAFGISAASVGAALTGGLSLVLTAVGTLLGGLAFEALGGADAFGAQEEAAASLAKEIDELNKALQKESQTQYSAKVETLSHAEAQRNLAIEAIKTRKALLENALQRQKDSREERLGGDQEGLDFRQAVGANYDRRVASLEGQIKQAEQSLAAANRTVNLSRRYFVDRGTQAGIDPRERIDLRYDQQRDQLDRRRGSLDETQYARERAKLDRERAAALESLSKAEDKAGGSTRRLRSERSSASTADREGAKAAREAEAANKQLESTYGSLIGKYDKAAASARDYAGELKDIADLVAGGKLTNLQAGDLVAAVDAVQLKKVQGEITADLNPNVEDITPQLKEIFEKSSQPLVDAGRDAADALREGARNVYEILGDGKLGRALGGLLQDLGLKGSDPSKNLAGQIKKLGDNILGPELSGSIGKAVGGAFQGAADGQFASSIANAVGLKQSKTGAAVGGAIGSLFGPLGGFAGGLIGGTLGGLLKKSKTGSANITSVDGDAAISGNSGKFKAAASSSAESVQAGLSQIAELLGGGVGGFNVTLGVRNGDYRVRTGTGSLKVKKGAKDFGDDEAGAIAYAQMLAISQGAITGLSAQIEKALKSSPDLNKALEEALKVQEIEILVGGIGAQFTKEFRDLERQAKERVRIATEYGFDVVAIEKKNAEDRAKLTEELLEQQVGSLQRLVKELTTGSLFEGSAVDRRTALLSEIEKAKGDLNAGKDGAGDTLAGLYEQLASVSKEVFGTTGQFAADRTRILNEAQAAIAKSNAQIEAASRTVSDPALADTNKALDENNDQNARIIAALDGLPAEIARYLSGGGSSQINLTALARTQER